MKLLHSTALVLPLLLPCPAEDDSGDSADGGTGSASADDGGAADDGGTADDGGDGTGTGGADGGETGEPVPCEPDGAPELDAIHAWLAGGGYSCWTKEANAHGSAGTHFVEVRVYVNSVLEQSLSTGSPSHPAGSVAVKELSDDGVVNGWAISIKVTDSDGSDGNAFHWYEERDGEVLTDMLGDPSCTGCHSVGNDHFQSTWPFG